MSDELVIRNEAEQFFKSKIERSNSRFAIDSIHELKNRLQDFYADESKSIFLDEIMKKTTAFFLITEMRLTAENLHLHAQLTKNLINCFFISNKKSILYLK